MESGVEVFFGAFLRSFKWDIDGAGIMWIQTIVTITAIFFAIRKDHEKSRKFTKLMLIVGFWGTLYGIILCCMAVGNPLFPRNQVELFFFSGLAASLLTLIYAAFGWFAITLIETLLVKKTTA